MQKKQFHPKNKQKRNTNQSQSKYYHPKDLVEIYHAVGRAKGDMEHLSYKVNYFFLKNLSKKHFDFRYDKVEINRQTTKTVKKMLSYRLQNLALLSNQSIVKIYEGNIASQLVHGLGAAHVLDTSITIHPVYGVPYIPSSSLKGIVRHYFIQTFFKGNGTKIKEEAKRTEKEEKLYRLYVDIFGSQEYRGSVNFLDVFFPSGTLRADIMAVHYRDYYGRAGSNPATDDQSPLPINFYVLTSKEPVEFIFYIHKNKELKSNFTHEEIANITGDWLQAALTHMGIGSKTSRGYGRFINLTEVRGNKLAELKRQKEVLEQERLEKERERKKKIEEEKLLSSMTDEERLVYTVQQLNPESHEDQEKSKSTIFNEVIETNSSEAAKELKQYWQQTNLWIEKKKPKKKQELKVIQIKELLNEE